MKRNWLGWALYAIGVMVASIALYWHNGNMADAITLFAAGSFLTGEKLMNHYSLVWIVRIEK